MKIDNDNTPIVMRGKIKDRTTYARLPIKNKYPLPTKDTHPMEAVWMRLRYAAFCIREQRYEEAHRALFLAADDLESMQFVYMEGGSMITAHLHGGLFYEEDRNKTYRDETFNLKNNQQQLGNKNENNI